MNDFFISYNNADVQWAKWVAGILEEYGYTTIIQAWDFKPGNNFIIEMQNAILSCKKQLLFYRNHIWNQNTVRQNGHQYLIVTQQGKRDNLFPFEFPI